MVQNILLVEPDSQSTGPKHYKKNIFAFALFGSKAAHGSTGPKAQLRVLQMAGPPVALTHVVRATWQDHGKFFD